MPENILIAIAWPYANAEIHVGNITGSHLPGDIVARSSVRHAVDRGHTVNRTPSSANPHTSGLRLFAAAMPSAPCDIEIEPATQFALGRIENDPCSPGHDLLGANAHLTLAMEMSGRRFGERETVQAHVHVSAHEVDGHLTGADAVHFDVQRQHFQRLDTPMGIDGEG